LGPWLIPSHDDSHTSASWAEVLTSRRRAAAFLPTTGPSGCALAPCENDCLQLSFSEAGRVFRAEKDGKRMEVAISRVSRGIEGDLKMV